MKTLALFDFDGTLYRKDSLIEFTRFAVGKTVFYKGMMAILPHLIGLKLNLLTNEKVKIRFLTYFFKGMEVGKFELLAKDFASLKIANDLNPKIFKAFIRHIESRHEVYIVSASAEEWITPWSNQYGITVIGTKLEAKGGILTGKLTSKNCYGIEKVNRIGEMLNITAFDVIAVYGSGKGDCEMLRLAKKI
jgi:phosphatidylglycerophosphatase C